MYAKHFGILVRLNWLSRQNPPNQGLPDEPATRGDREGTFVLCTPF